MSASVIDTPRFPTGVTGLDEVLLGGLPRGALMLIEGPPGSGKTTIAVQFLLQALRQGESCLLVSNAETPAQLSSIAASHGWSLEGIRTTHFTQETEEGAAEASDYTLFPEAEIEVGETLQHLFAEVERLRPTLLVLDTISALRVLAPSPNFHRRQLRRIRDFMATRACTTIFLDESSQSEKDLRSQTLADGIIELQKIDYGFGADRRRLRVRKLRGCRYLSGAHDFTITTGGLVVYPRLVAQSYTSVASAAPLQSGVTAIDELTGGGLPRGSSTLIVGPAGAGKSIIGSLYSVAAAAQGEKSSILLFEESVETYAARAKGLGLDWDLASKSINIAHLDPAELSSGQIAQLLVRQVEDQNVKVVVIDTLNGYLQSAMEEPTVLLQIRELISYLNRRKVVTLLAVTQHGILGPETAAPIDLSFLADNVLLLRYFETEGTIRKALSMVKKRSGRHEHTIREFIVQSGSVQVGAPLSNFTGVLTGTPVYQGAAKNIEA